MNSRHGGALWNMKLINAAARRFKDKNDQLRIRSVGAKRRSSARHIGGRARDRGGCASRGLVERAHFASPRRNGGAVFTNGGGLDDEAAPLQRRAKGLGGCRLVRVEPDHQHACGTQEIRQPVERRLKGSERALPPI